MNTPATSSSLAVLGGPKAVTRAGPHFQWPPVTALPTSLTSANEKSGEGVPPTDGEDHLVLSRT